MTEILSLPDYPATDDVFSRLARETRPIVVYGMGNGADKLLARFREYGITVADFFASDGFVRGHFFHGKRVLSFAEVRDKYPEFCIVLSFATNREDVLMYLLDLDRRYGMVMPDLPVAGDDTFNAAYYNAHFSDIVRAYDLLADDESRALYSSVLHYKLSGNIRYLSEHTVSPADCYALFPTEELKTVIDCGAYNGDTVREFLSINPSAEHIYAIEPDEKNLKKLCRYLEENDLSDRVTAVGTAVSSHSGTGIFASGGNRNSTLFCGSYQNKERAVPLITVDSLSENIHTDYLKYDVEGAEAEALRGSENTVRRDRPCITLSAYHRNEDIFALPLQLHAMADDYLFYYRRTACLPAWELRLIAVPKEKIRQKREV